MIWGMLWVDNSKDELSKKIETAVIYYLKKYEAKPDICFVHPKALEKEAVINNIRVRPDKYILPHHLWIGIEEKAG